jgi:hypothetical protein
MLIARLTHTAPGRAGLLAALVALAFAPATAAYAGKKSKHVRPTTTQTTASRSSSYCSITADLQEQGCLADQKDTFFTARAICTNTSDAAERGACLEDANDELRAGTQLCDDQDDAREDLCARIGEARYEPDFDPAHFDDPRSPTHPNPYFPIAVGNHWSVSGGGDNVEIEVLNKVKSIDGVLCIVVNDTAYDASGVPLEITDDWFAQRKDGGVMYCGENTAEYETFAGDNPLEPERVSMDGTFKAGRDGDKPGLLMQSTPRVGASYRQEWSAGNAEDAATVLSTTYSFGHDALLDQLVPPVLAQLLCSAGDCVVTAEFSPLSPSGLEHKYFAKGIGFFLATKPGSGGVEQLVGCNMDARCSSLPQP